MIRCSYALTHNTKQKQLLNTWPRTPEFAYVSSLQLVRFVQCFCNKFACGCRKIAAVLLFWFSPPPKHHFFWILFTFCFSPKYFFISLFTFFLSFKLFCGCFSLPLHFFFVYPYITLPNFFILKLILKMELNHFKLFFFTNFHFLFSRHCYTRSHIYVFSFGWSTFKRKKTIFWRP